MKTTIFYISLIIGCLGVLQPVTAQTSEKEFVIEGTFRDFAVMPSKVYLYRFNRTNGLEREQVLSDSTIVKNGKFSIRGKVTEVTPMQLASSIPENDNQPKVIFIDRANLHVGGGAIHIILDKHFKD